MRCPCSQVISVGCEASGVTLGGAWGGNLGGDP